MELKVTFIQRFFFKVIRNKDTSDSTTNGSQYCLSAHISEEYATNLPCRQIHNCQKWAVPFHIQINWLCTNLPRFSPHLTPLLYSLSWLPHLNTRSCLLSKPNIPKYQSVGTSETSHYIPTFSSMVGLDSPFFTKKTCIKTLASRTSHWLAWNDQTPAIIWQAQWDF